MIEGRARNIVWLLLRRAAPGRGNDVAPWVEMGIDRARKCKKFFCLAVGVGLSFVRGGSLYCRDYASTAESNDWKESPLTNKMAVNAAAVETNPSPSQRHGIQKKKKSDIPPRYISGCAARGPAPLHVG